MPNEATPIFVELEGTLTRANTGAESLCGIIATQPRLLPRVLWTLRRGIVTFKDALARVFTPDVSTLPYHAELLNYLTAEKQSGRPVYLVSSANTAVATKVAEHLGLFDGVLASDQYRRRDGSAVLEAMKRTAGSGRFCFISSVPRGMRVWGACESAAIVGAIPNDVRAVESQCRVERVFTLSTPTWATYLRAVRSHQWVKNALLFVAVLPGLTQMTIQRFGSVLVGCVAFSLCSSSFYIVNDLLDLPADRIHSTKRLRPFASGELDVAQGLALCCLLLVAGLLCAVLVSQSFLLAVLTYLAITATYSLGAKRVVLLDVLILAGLYALRVAAGALAASLRLSFWLLAFSMALFLSLAFAKRYGELHNLAKLGREWPAGRGYRSSDMPIVEMFGIASGLSAVLTLALYLQQDAARMAFRRPWVLGALCPVLLYWISRVWLHAHRGLMNEDPVVFATKDRVSRFVLLISAVIVAASDL